MDIKQVTTNNFTMNYFSFGNGPKAMVMLPGMSMHPVTFLADAVAGQYKMFCEDFTVYLFDRKNEMQDDYSVYDMAEDTAAAMNELGIKNACIYGSSQGGMMALTIAARHKDLAGKIAICSSSSYTGADESSKENFSTWMDLAKRKDVVQLNRNMFHQVYTEGYLKKYERAFSRLELEGSNEELRRVYIMAKACFDFDLRNELKNITCPAFVIAAENDLVFKASQAKYIADTLGCEFYEYKNASHAVYDEASDIKDRIYNFFIR